MWAADLPPSIPFFAAALLIALARSHALRAAVGVAVPILGGLHLWLDVEPGLVTYHTLFEFQLMPFRTDRLSLLFGYIFHIAAFIGMLYALHLRDRVQQVVAMLYAGSALGAVFAGDLLTLFLYWEGMALTSVFLIWARGTSRSLAAGQRYLLIQVLSGLLLLAGTLLIFQQRGTLQFTEIGLDGTGAGGWLILLAFGIKAAFPGLHSWLTDAYPEATPTGTVFLSTFTTKAAVYALARGYPGTELLIYVGATMACFPIFYAVIENDLRRVLAYSLINQVGFMVTGIGIGTSLALNGTVAHAFSHILYKSLLFMSMGAVLKMTGKINGSDLGHLYKTMPKTAVLCIIGAASISAFPLFSGFVSKSMVMSALLENGNYGVWLVMLFAAAGVFHHAGIKIPYFAFFAHDSGIRTEDPPWNMVLAMSLAAFLCVFIGCYPAALYSLLPYDTGYSPYDASHVLTQTQLLFFSAGAFVWLQMRGLYPPELRSVNLDVEWFYRKVAPWMINAARRIARPLVFVWRFLLSGVWELLTGQLHRHHGVEGTLARTWPIGSMVLWVAILLATYLLLSYL